MNASLAPLLALTLAWGCLPAWASGPAELPFALPLPPGASHVQTKSGATPAGEVRLTDGLVIAYEIGVIPRAGQAVAFGRYVNRAARVAQAPDARWSRQETVNGQPGYFAQDGRGTLHASFPAEAVNFRVNAPDPAQIDAALALLRGFGRAELPPAAPVALTLR
jgi:hypothetical protein